MKKTTLRYHVYHAPNDSHNSRAPEAIARENVGAERGEKARWIDPQGVHEVFGPGQTLLEAYETVFGDAIAEYNSRQKRADRKMTVDSYLQSVEDSRRGRPVKAIKRANERAKAQGREEDVRKEAGQRSHHEIVMSLGNVKPLRDAATGKVVMDAKTGLRERPNYIETDVMRQIFKDYVDGFAARNPNLYLYRADFHADEWYRVTTGGQTIKGLPLQWLPGQSHGHLEVVAHADGYQRGPKRQASITKALAAMGYADYQDATGRTVTAWEQWQDAEQDAIKEIARAYGYEIVPADDSREALAADEYAELAELRDAVQDAKADLKETLARTATLKEREDAVVSRERSCDRRERAVDTREREQDARQQEQDEQRERLKKAADLLEQQKREAGDLDERLPRLRKAAQDEQDKADRAKQEAEEAVLKAVQWSQHFKALEQEEQAIQARIAALRGKESEAYRDAQERGYRDGVKHGASSASRQMYLATHQDDGEELTDEQKRENAKRYGVGLG